MKSIIFLIVIIILPLGTFASVSADSLAYLAQRKKINAMLADRTTKFGQYNESLTQHSGIFGVQTKKDIRRSNDILMDIVTTDNDIYKQLKILLQYRIFQQTQVQNHARETEQSVVGYMQTINKLRGQIDQLKADAAAQQSKQEKLQRVYIGVIIAMLVVMALLVVRKRRKIA